MSIGQLYLEHFGMDPLVTTLAHGRVNLIGEHIDYNGGTVLPTQISRVVEVAMGPHDDSSDIIYSEAFGESVTRQIGSPASKHWSDYVVGALTVAREIGVLTRGVKVAIKSDLPHGSGVSSSAAIIVASLRAAQELQQLPYDPVEIAKLAQRVEHQYIGMPCGIMDQMAVAVAKPGYALALDTKTLDFSHVQLPEDYHFAVVFSGVMRRLDEGRYAIRREECEQAAQALGVNDICTMPPEKVLLIDSIEETLSKRARHVYTEHRRVLKTVEALEQNDIHRVGSLMEISHQSMRDDFEITTSEVDAVVSSAIELGALGARMTGGGFGGCIVACVPKTDLEVWANNLEQRHTKAKFIC